MKANRATMCQDRAVPDREFALRLNPVEHANPSAIVNHPPGLLEVQVLEDLIAPGLSTVPGLVGNHNEAILAVLRQEIWML